MNVYSISQAVCWFEEVYDIKSLERAVADAATKQIVPLKSLSQIPEHIQGNGGTGGLGRIGLELDELPIIGRGSSTLLTEGMVVALEPKFVFPGQGAVGIENTFVVTRDGMKKLNEFPDAIVIC